ncbi:MAG: exo-alpha-sialidase [Armatimonadetes bacterium]|nr:exo-alpha-sialidase [Candidatus Hippobium faecium]
MNKSKEMCFVTAYPKDKYYDEEFRRFQGIPTIAITKNGRIFVGWEAGGITEPDVNQYCILHYSDDGGKTWSDPVYVIDANHKEKIWIGDIQLWIDSNNDLHIFWVQHEYKNYIENAYNKDSVMSPDIWTMKSGATWDAVCKDPDAEKLSFEKPKYVFDGQMRNRPLVTKTGRIIYPAYDEYNIGFRYVYSDDGGKTFETGFSTSKVKTDGDEQMFYQKDDGTIVYNQRTLTGFIGVAYSKDNGDTWSEAENSSIVQCPSRFCIDKLENGHLCLIGNDCFTDNFIDDRINMTIQLSEDEGETWTKKLLDSRWQVSYPEFAQYKDKIYCVWDRERFRAKEILFCAITEEEIKDKDFVPELSVISKSDMVNFVQKVYFPNAPEQE